MSDTLNTQIAKVIYKDYEDCDDEYVERVWAGGLDEFDTTVAEFEEVAEKVLAVADAAVNIEAAAEALWEDETPVLGLPQPWDKQDEGLKHEYRVAARRTVDAALGRR